MLHSKFHLGDTSDIQNSELYPTPIKRRHQKLTPIGNMCKKQNKHSMDFKMNKNSLSKTESNGISDLDDITTVSNFEGAELVMKPQ